jgi:uncharacterized protein YjbI with pentapeptide repeats
VRTYTKPTRSSSVRTDVNDLLARFVHLERAFLRGAHLERANLEGARLVGTHLEGASGLTIEQLATVKCLYGVHLDQSLLVQVQQEYPHLLELHRN